MFRFVPLSFEAYNLLIVAASRIVVGEALDMTQRRALVSAVHVAGG